MVNIYTYHNGKYKIQYVSVTEDELQEDMDELFRQGIKPNHIIISNGYDLMCRNMERLENE